MSDNIDEVMLKSLGKYPPSQELRLFLSKLQELGMWPLNVSAASLQAQGIYPLLDVRLTAADLATLHSAAYSLVAAPGATSGIEAVQATAVVQHNGAVLAPGAAYINIRHGVAAGPIASYPFQLNQERVFRGDAAVQEYDSSSVDVADWLNKGLVLFAAADLDISGGIADFAINDGGADFEVDDEVEIPTSGSGDPATGVVTAVSGGAITALTLTSAPDGYLLSTALAITATTGIGTAATIDITELDYSLNPITVDLRVRYGVRDVA